MEENPKKTGQNEEGSAHTRSFINVSFKRLQPSVVPIGIKYISGYKSAQKYAISRVRGATREINKKGNIVNDLN